MGEALPKDYYAVLNVPPAASQDEIRASYRKLARRWHPDHSREAEAPVRFRLIQEAWETLRDPSRRRAYDESRVFRGRPRREPPKVGRDALTWVENFFIQAGSIEVEGPGRGALRRFSVNELEDIWHTIVTRLRAAGESRQAIQRFQLLEHYIRRHPELKLPGDAETRLQEKAGILVEFEALRRRAAAQWSTSPPLLEDLLRKRRFNEARACLMWKAAHDMADRLATTGLFESLGRGALPLRELSMIDRLESIASGETPARSVGHGYLACRRCGGWALESGVGPPRCAQCGGYRFRLRAREEEDDLLQYLVGRRLPRFSPQFNAYMATVQESVERWIFTPMFLLATLAVSLMLFRQAEAVLPWFATLLAATGWFAGAWGTHQTWPADMMDLFPRERAAATRIGAVLRNGCALVLTGLGLLLPVAGLWATAAGSLAAGVLVFFGPEIRDRLTAPPRD